MKAAELSSALAGRRIGRGKYLAHCPGPLHAYGDRDPSLPITEGKDGRILLYCRVGCDTGEVLKAAGLTWADLFSGPPPTPEQAREAARQQAIAEAEAEARRRERRELADKYRKLDEVQEAIAARLADLVFHSPEMSEGEEREADALAAVLHSTIDKIREIEAIYEQQEAQGFHDRLRHYCEKHRIDRQRLLAPYTQRDDEHTTEAA